MASLISGLGFSGLFFLIFDNASSKFKSAIQIDWLMHAQYVIFLKLLFQGQEIAWQKYNLSFIMVAAKKIARQPIKGIGK